MVPLPEQALCRRSLPEVTRYRRSTTRQQQQVTRCGTAGNGNVVNAPPYVGVHVSMFTRDGADKIRHTHASINHHALFIRGRRPNRLRRPSAMFTRVHRRPPARGQRNNTLSPRWQRTRRLVMHASAPLFVMFSASVRAGACPRSQSA